MLQRSFSQGVRWMMAASSLNTREELEAVISGGINFATALALWSCKVTEGQDRGEGGFPVATADA